MSSPSEDERNGADIATPNGDAEQELNDEMDDLFGDDVDEEAEAKVQRRDIDDEDLDSGDDEGRDDRAPADDEVADTYENVEQELQSMEVDLGRHPIPESGDGEGYLLKVPQFLAIDPVAFSLEGFQPPTTDHHSTTAAANFSAYKTAQTTIRWRQSPSTSEPQSNARILRWSDGSLTLQMASDPIVQYEITHRALAPPQPKPLKPTPLSKPNQTRGWSEKQDAFTYLAAASQEAFIVRTTNKITAALQVNTIGDADDEALQRLQTKMAAARGPNHGTVNLATAVEDPETQRRKAEQAEKETIRAQRRLEAQQTRERERSNRVLGRSSGRAGGLSVAGLEEEGTGGASGQRRTQKKAPRRRRNNDEYSDEEEQFGSGYRGYQDAYDTDDGFIAKSDDEEEDGEGEEDIDDLDAVIERREQEQRGGRAATPKRDRDAEVEEDDEEGGGARDSPVTRHKRRRVVEDDDDDE